MHTKVPPNQLEGAVVEKIDHIGIVVGDLDKAMNKWEAMFGAKAQHIEILKEHFVRVAFVPMGGVLIEMLEPSADTGVIGEFLRNHGEGFHHIAYRVEELQPILEELKKKRISLSPIFHKDYTPFHGTRGSLIAFLSPKETNNVLIELVEIRDKE